MQDSAQYAKVIANSKRIRWDIDADVIRGRQFDYDKTFLPHGLSLATELPFLSAGQVRLFSQVQGRTYCYLFGLVERFIAAKVLGLSAHYWLGDQTPLEALVRLADEELKHQELFRRLEDRMEDAMPLGYIQTAEADAVAQFVLSKGDWAVLALTLHIELFTLAHYRASIDRDEDVCPLWKDVFLAHWQEESQHAVLDELEFLRADARLAPEERERGVTELIELVVAVDGLLRDQARADTRYFFSAAGTEFTPAQNSAIADTFLKAYRWQYIVSGVMQPRFQQVLFGTLDDSQKQRIGQALEPLMYAQPVAPSAIVAAA
ncbi:MAG TPA: hypothetical protein VFF16_17730 [Telluria sp.]|nr:hypothetical protein [Telluria sp.]